MVFLEVRSLSGCLGLVTKDNNAVCGWANINVLRPEVGFWGCLVRTSWVVLQRSRVFGPQSRSRSQFKSSLESRSQSSTKSMDFRSKSRVFGPVKRFSASVKVNNAQSGQVLKSRSGSDQISKVYWIKSNVYGGKLRAPSTLAKHCNQLWRMLPVKCAAEHPI